MKADDLVWRENRNRRDRDALSKRKVVRVGRSYGYTDQMEKINLKTMSDQFGYRYYRSQEEYGQSVVLAKAWHYFHSLVESQFSRPDHLTLEDIYRMTKIVREPK